MTRPRDSWLIGVYRRLLRLLPEDLHREFGEDMKQHFADLARDAGRNPWLQARTLAIGIWDVGVHAVSARASVTGLLGLVSCAALWTPVRSATQVDPARSLQGD